MRTARYILPLLALLLGACEFTLAGDITPPPDAVPSDAATSTSTPALLEFPGAMPDAVAGSALYAQNCAACHGLTGRGDGEQAAALPVPPAPIGTVELADAASPAEWFRIITQGNLNNFMPPFAERLSVQQRWDVLAYVFSLSWDETLMPGAPQVYAEHRAEIEAALPPLDDLRQMAGLTRHDIVGAIELALPSLSSAQLVALGAYVQSLSLGGEADTELTAGSSLSGRVQAGGGGSLPAGLQVTLFGYEGDVLVHMDTAKVAVGGRFVFQHVPWQPGRTFFASVDYLGLSYFSEFVTDATQTEFEQPITIYETTSGTDMLAIERLTVIFEFDRPGYVRVVQQYLLSNIGEQAVTPSADGRPALVYELPAGASDLAFNEGRLGERYVSTETGFGDLRAVLPGLGSYQLLFGYQLPYGRGLTLPLALQLPARSVLLLIQDGSVAIESGDFAPAGVQDIQGISYQAFLSTRAFSAGEQPELRLRGRNPLGGGLVASDSLLAGLAALCVAVGAAWLWLHRRQQVAPNVLLESIAALDDQYAAGKLNEVKYRSQRTRLKEQLRKAFKDD